MSTVRIQVRRGVSTGSGSWYSVNPTLAAGEIGLETDTGNFKFGDGSTAWNALGYALLDSLGDYIPLTQKGVASGIASLDSSGFVPVAQLPPLAKVTVSSVANQAARLALTAEVGDIAIQADSGASYILQTTGASTDANWKELVGNEKVQDVIGAMLSGNTETGITVTYEDSDGTIDFVVADQFSTHSTTDLSEGTNLYFTEERAQDAIGNFLGSGLAYNDTTGAVSVDTANIQARVANVTDVEIGYLDGVTSSIQTQIDTKYNKADDLSLNFGKVVIFEGATDDIYETTLNVVDPTADRIISLPNASGTVIVSDANGNVTVPGNLTVSGSTTYIDSTVINIQNEIKFEGTTANDFETSLTAIDPTADRTISLPDATGTIVLANNTQTLSSKSINLNTNTVTGTISEFNTAVSDADLATLAGTETLTNKTLTSPVINTPTGITKSDVGLANVDNTTDANKPVSSATQTALDAKQSIVTGITDTEIGYLDGVTSAIQTQIDTKLSSATAATTYQTIITDVSNTEISYLNGVTSGIQGQIDGKQTVVANVSDTEISYLNGVTDSIQTQIDTKLSSATASATYAPLASPTFTGTVTLPANTISQSHLSDDSVGTNEIGGLAVTNGKLAGDIGWDKLAISSTVSAVEAGYLDGVTGAIQTQLNGKQATVANVSDVEIGYLDGVTSSIQTQLGNKQAVVANVSDVEIGYLDGVTSAIQTQIDAKLASATAASTYAPLASPALTGTPTATLAVTGTNTTQIATTSFVQQELAVLTTGAPAALNTLDELAAALGDDANYAATITTALGNKAPLASPTFTGTVTLPAAGIVFTDGTQAKEGVPSRTPIIQKTASYTLSALTERDDLIEMGSASALTLTIPADVTLDFPIGTSIDILQTGVGQVTIAGSGFTPNATPGLKLRTQWSSCTLFKRAANTWVVFGDLTA